MKKTQIRKANKKAAKARKFKRVRNLARALFTRLGNLKDKQNIIDMKIKRDANPTEQWVSTKKKKLSF